MGARPVAPARIAGFGVAPALTGLFWAVCRWEIKRARDGERPYVEALPGSGTVRAGLAGPPLRVTWLGDSLAAGLGCDDVADTPAHLTARLLERPVELTVLAVPGARVGDVLDTQLPQLDRRSDLVVVCVGANDVASPIRRREFATQLDALLAELAPLPTISLSLPDMSVPDRLAQPLRSIAGARSRWFEMARRRVAVAHDHVVSVDIARRPPGVSRRDARELLCADRFHPGPHAYRVWAERVAAACTELLESSAAPGPRTTFAD